MEKFTRNPINEKTITKNNKQVKIKKYGTPNKKKSNYRPVHFTCPYCLSPLQQNEEGKTICSGENIKYIKEDLIAYDMMTKEQKEKYIESLQERNEFLHYYRLWKVNGTIDCGAITCYNMSDEYTRY